MKYFIDPNNTTFLNAYEDDGSQDHLIPTDFIEATQSQIDAILHPPVSPNVAILSQIFELESTITIRRLREAAISPEGTQWMVDIDAQIAALRAQLV